MKLLFLLSLLLLLVAPMTRADTTSPIQATPSVLGGVFLDGEPIQWEIKSGGALRWQVTDFSGALAASGVGADGRLTLPLRKNGYFLLHLTADPPGQKTVERDCAFAILAPVPKREAASPFGVMTHFAQGWNQDIIPLIARLGVGGDRDEQYWNAVEKTPGEFVFPLPFQSYMASLGQNGIASLVPLTFESSIMTAARRPTQRQGLPDTPATGRKC